MMARALDNALVRKLRALAADPGATEAERRVATEKAEAISRREDQAWEESERARKEERLRQLEIYRTIYGDVDERVNGPHYSSWPRVFLGTGKVIASGPESLAIVAEIKLDAPGNFNVFVRKDGIIELALDVVSNRRGGIGIRVFLREGQAWMGLSYDELRRRGYGEFPCGTNMEPEPEKPKRPRKKKPARQIEGDK
jgi:hypothetical protein